MKNHIKELRKNPDLVKKEYAKVETINIELEHSVAKLLSENENLGKEIAHVKQLYKEQFDSIKKSRVSHKEHYDALVVQMNLKSVANADLQAQIQEKIFAIEKLENELKQIKGKNVVDSVVFQPQATTTTQGKFRIAIEPLPVRLFKIKDAHIDYIQRSRIDADVLRDLVEEARTLCPLDWNFDAACKYAERLQEELVYLHDTCPCLSSPKERLIAYTNKTKVSKVQPAAPFISSKPSEKLIVVTPMNKQRKVRLLNILLPLATVLNR